MIIGIVSCMPLLLRSSHSITIKMNMEGADMTAADKLGGYATGFGELNAETVAANVTDDYKLLDKDGKTYGKGDLPQVIMTIPQVNNDLDMIWLNSDERSIKLSRTFPKALMLAFLRLSKKLCKIDALHFQLIMKIE